MTAKHGEDFQKQLKGEKIFTGGHNNIYPLAWSQRDLNLINQDTCKGFFSFLFIPKKRN